MHFCNYFLALVAKITVTYASLFSFLHANSWYGKIFDVAGALFWYRNAIANVIEPEINVIIESRLQD